MFFLNLFLGIIAFSTISGAANIPTTRNAVPKKLVVTPINSDSAGEGTSIFNVKNMNVRYATTITVNGVELSVALDTGSTDLWVQAPGGLGTFNDTKMPLSLRYGDGTYGVDGTIGMAPVEIGPYKVDHQAFLNATYCNIGGMEDIGLNGLLGLGFDQAFGSPIIDEIQNEYGLSATWGASLLNNIFSQNPQQPNFVAFDLSRSEDLESSGDGSFTIGEYDPDYIAVQNAPKLPKFPPPPVGYRWSATFDAIQVNGKPIGVSSGVKNVPKGKGVALLDTGNPSATVPDNILDAVYSGVKDAVKSTDLGKWIVPCTSKSLPALTFVFGGQAFPIHPLDLSDMTTATIGGNNYTYCASSLTYDDSIIVNEFDIALGDTFLRNVYSVYDFGNTSSNGKDAYIQLLSKTDITKAYSDYTSSRMNALKRYPDPEILPGQLLKLLFPESDSSVTADASINDKDQTRLAESSETNSSLVDKYGATIIGLLAGNIVIGLILVVLGVLQYIRRGASSSESRIVNPRYAPVRNKMEESNIGYYGRPYSQ